MSLLINLLDKKNKECEKLLKDISLLQQSKIDSKNNDFPINQNLLVSLPENDLADIEKKKIELLNNFVQMFDFTRQLLVICAKMVIWSEEKVNDVCNLLSNIDEKFNKAVDEVFNDTAKDFLVNLDQKLLMDQNKQFDEFKTQITSVFTNMWKNYEQKNDPKNLSLMNKVKDLEEQMKELKDIKSSIDKSKLDVKFDIDKIKTDVKFAFDNIFNLIKKSAIMILILIQLIIIYYIFS